MKIEKIVIISILAIFVIGISIGTVSATKNTDGSADLKISAKNAQVGPIAKVKYTDKNIHLTKDEVKKLEQNKTVTKKNVALFSVQMKTKTKQKVKVTYKKPVYGYKYKKVTEWVTIKVCNMDSYSYCDEYSGSTSNVNHNINKYYNNYKKYKYCGTSYKIVSSSLNYQHVKYYTHFKYKKTYTKKVKYVKYYKKATKYEYRIVTSKKWTPIKFNITIKRCGNNYIVKIPHINNYGETLKITFNNNFNKKGQCLTY